MNNGTILKSATGGEGAQENRELRSAQVTAGLQQQMFEDTVVGHVPEASEELSDYYGPMPFGATLMEGALDRAVTSTMTVTPAMGKDVLLGNIQLPLALLGDPQIQSKLRGWKYFRCKGIRVEFRVNTTPFIGGALMAYYAPTPTYSTTMPLVPTYVDAFSWPNVIIDLSTAAQTALEIPFICPNHVIDVTQMLEDYLAGTPNGLQYSLASVNVLVVWPLNFSAAGLPTNVTLTVTTRFTEPEVFVPTAYNLPTEGTEAQSGLLQGFAANAVSKIGGDMASDSISEAVTAARRGADVGLGTGSHDAKPKLTTIPVIGGMLGTAKRFLGSLGLQKPTAVETTTSTSLDYDRSMSCSEGVDVVDRLMPGKVAYVATDPAFGGDEVPMDTISAIISTPTISGEFALNSTSLKYQYVLRPNNPVTSPSNGLVYQTFPGTVLKFLQVWRGSQHVMVYFFCAQNVSARVRISYMPTPNAMAGVTSQSYISHTIDIQGSTMKKFMFPFLTNKPVLTGSDDVGTIEFELITAVSSAGAVDYPLRVLVFSAMGPDAAMSWPGSSAVWGTPQCDIRKEFAGGFEPFHPTFTMSEGEGFVNPDPIRSVSDIVKYYTPLYKAGFSATGDGTLQQATVEMWGDVSWNWSLFDWNGVSTVTLWTLIDLMFEYKRGSTRYKVVCSPSNGAAVGITTAIAGMNVTLGPSDLTGMVYEGAPIVRMDTAYRSMVDFEVPFNGTSLFHALRPNRNEFERTSGEYDIAWTATMSLSALNATTNIGHYEVYAAAGDDLRYAFLHGPGPLVSGTSARLRVGTNNNLDIGSV